MNLVERLLEADVKKVNELKTEKIISERLGRITGAEKGEEITIREIPAKRLNDLLAKQFDDKGRFDISKSFEAKALTVAEAVVEPDLKNEELRGHFSCSTTKDLAIKLFGNEINGISDKVVELSGIGEVKKTDEEIKN